MQNLLMICLGACFGASSRYYLDVWITSRLGAQFPFATLAINLLGCLILGFFSSLVIQKGAWIPPGARLVVAVGFVSSFTTFSTFGLETLGLLQTRHALWAALYAGGSVLFGLVAVYLGGVAARALP